MAGLCLLTGAALVAKAVNAHGGVPVAPLILGGVSGLLGLGLLLRQNAARVCLLVLAGASLLNGVLAFTGAADLKIAEAADVRRVLGSPTELLTTVDALAVARYAALLVVTLYLLRPKVAKACRRRG